MRNSNRSSDYVVIANLVENEKISVFIAYKEKNTLDNLYIVNQFCYDKDDMYFFKKLFSLFNSDNRPKEFVDFFVKNNKFYAVFKYQETQGIKEKYEKNLSVTAFDDRCKILELILMKISIIPRIHHEILGCASEPENIRVDENKNVFITYNLQNIFKYRGSDTKTIFENIKNIILDVLPAECNAKFNKQLHIVLRKCTEGVYSSIPELIVELRKAENISKATSWISYFKYRLSFYKPLFSKVGKAVLTCSVIAGLIYLGYSKINDRMNTNQAAAAVTIGGITYNGNANDESEKVISAENQDNQNNTKSSEDIILSEGLDMEYEDYVVQQDDTISSICDQYYKDKKYITAIATFNGMETTDKLTPGTILKLPNRTAIALYISK